MAKRYLVIERKFDAAHKLVGYNGDCAKLHGHTWKVVCKFKFIAPNEQGIAIDFKTLKKVVDNAIPDHQYLNDWMTDPKENPTAENISKELFRNIHSVLPIVSIEVWESDHAYAVYEDEEA